MACICRINDVTTRHAVPMRNVHPRIWLRLLPQPGLAAGRADDVQPTIIKIQHKYRPIYV